MNTRSSLHICLMLLTLLFLILGCVADPEIDDRIQTLQFEPTAIILSPVNNSAFVTGDTIRFTGEGRDLEDANEILSVKWSSDKDGILDASHPDPDGQISFSTIALSRNTHSITLAVSDSDGNVSRDSINVHNNVPSPVSILSLVSDTSTVALTWTRSDALDFSSYRIYRSTSGSFDLEADLLAIVTAVQDTALIDQAIDIVPFYSYQVLVFNQSGVASVGQPMTIQNPGGITLAIEPYDALIHPSEDWLYIQDRNAEKLFSIDYRSNAVRDTLDFPTRPGYMDIGDNGFGMELYIPFNDNAVRIYRADDLTQVTSILTGISYVYCAMTDGLGRVFASLSPSPWWEDPMRSYSRATGAFIDGNGHLPGTSFDTCRLKLLPSGNEIIEIADGISPVDMDYYKLDSAGNFVSHSDDSYHGDHPLSPHVFRVAPVGGFLITSTLGAVYNADQTMTFQGLLPREDAYFADYCFDESGGTIYAGCQNKDSIWIFDVASLKKTGEIATRGQVKYLFRKGNDIVVVLVPSGSNGLVAIQVITIP